ncbi:MAG: DUF4150 domain-containing protein [Polyangiaceae bacterium]|nr:DUF4150 domain-containing protein [Polyangiaceae bacterium]
MLPAANKGVGLNICAPDVCRTPPPPGIPIPYVNFGAHAIAVPFSPVVFVCALPALNVSAKIPKTFGDEPGVLHPVFMRVGTFVMGCPNVFVDNLPAIHLTLPTTGNAMNAPVGAHLVPNVVNVFYNDAGVPSLVESGVSTEAVESLSERVYTAPAPTLQAVTDLTSVASGLYGSGFVLHIPLFTEETRAIVYSLFYQHNVTHETQLVVDLRGCPGGSLLGAVQLASDFLSEGDIALRTVDTDGDESIRRVHQNGPHKMPVTLLVDHGTASAAEAFAAALLHAGRASLHGSQTYGKGSVESLFFEGGSAHYTAVGRCLHPSGAEIHGRGISPPVRLCKPIAV